MKFTTHPILRTTLLFLGALHLYLGVFALAAGHLEGALSLVFGDPETVLNTRMDPLSYWAQGYLLAWSGIGLILGAYVLRQDGEDRE